MNLYFSAEEASNIAKNLKVLRVKLLRMTQKEFSDSVQLAQTSLSAFEMGKRQISSDAIVRICDTHHVRREWLLRDELPVFLDQTTIVAKAQSIRLPADAKKSILLQALGKMIESLPDDAVGQMLADLTDTLSQLEEIDDSDTAEAFESIVEKSEKAVEK